MVKKQTAKKPKVCLVLQGGGALGAYHIGAYQALEEAGFAPDWYAGISIGAINCAILAGNKPAERLAKLTEFWDRISRPESAVDLPPEMASMFNMLSVSQALSQGQPDFFVPRAINPFMAPPGEGATSFYDTSPLLKTLNELTDFSLINKHKSRLTVGATQVTRGNLVFFDSKKEPLTASHILASGSLPPGFPAVKIGEEYYWDGGCVSNSPINGILDLAEPDEDLLIFMVDLWSAKGALPETMNEVLWRQKEIQYASRSYEHIDAVITKRNLEHILEKSLEVVDSKEAPEATSLHLGKKIDIVHVTFEPLQGHNPLSDAEFSRRSIRLRREQAYADMTKAIEQSPWTQKKSSFPIHFHRRKAEGNWVEKKVTKTKKSVA